MRIYTSQSMKFKSIDSLKQLHIVDKFDINKQMTFDVNVNIPMSVRQNGSMFVHVCVFPSIAASPMHAAWHIVQSAALTKYAVRQASTFQLVGDATQNTEQPTTEVNKIPVSHWQSRLTVNIMTDTSVKFDYFNTPGELYRYIRVDNNDKYLPVLFLNELCNRIKDLVPLNASSKVMSLSIIYEPISFGKLRLCATMKESFNSLMQLGFQDRDIDEMKGLLVDTNLYALLLTFVVAAFHLLFDFLAFKNDIIYWRQRKTMVGLSTKTVIWRCVSTFIVFLYLLDEQTSLLVLIPTGIGAIIEFWKVFKALKVNISWSGSKLFSVNFGGSSVQEKETEQLDSQAMNKLSYLLYPLCLAGAVYSLLYSPHKSWYSWCIQSLVNGVYAFGFLFMLPQLYINYKLKSVAHLPWRAFMYKAFNTFIDDVFAFIITMPTAHRLACFRDDIVFLIYLYQRWLYPVDRSRVNEFGQSFEESKKDQ
jgi:hypothetical protein